MGTQDQPTSEDPRPHLRFIPATGAYEGRTAKGEASIRVFGLARRTLERRRVDQWLQLQWNLTVYGCRTEQGRHHEAAQVAEVTKREPHASLLLPMLDIIDAGNPGQLVLPDAAEAVAAHPEIRNWLNG